MKKLGLIGGTGYESTLVYYKYINQLVNKESNGDAFPEITIESVNLCHALSLVKNKQYNELEDYLWSKIENLIKCGCDVVALTAITMHIVYDRLKHRMEKYATIPLVGMPKMACDVALRRGCRRALLLGTIFTMSEYFFKKEFVDNGIEIIVPDVATMEIVQTIIVDELELGIVKPQSQQTLIDIITSAKIEKQADVVILGCTELPLALNNGNTPIPCLDVMDEHIKELVSICIQ